MTTQVQVAVDVVVPAAAPAVVVQVLVVVKRGVGAFAVESAPALQSRDPPQKSSQVEIGAVPDTDCTEHIRN